MKLLAFLFFIYAALAIVPPLAPLSIRPDFPVGYFGQPPSSAIDPSLVGPVELLNSTIDFNLDQGTITLPLYHGTVANGQGGNSSIWYIVTDASSEAAAITLGVHFTPKLAFVDRQFLRTATGTVALDLTLDFSAGFVDFNSQNLVIPGQSPNFWPIDATSTAGSIGDADYTSLVYLDAERLVLNAPIIAGSSVTANDLNVYCNGIPSGDTHASTILHDKVVSICPSQNSVTLKMSYGVSFSRPFWYLAMDSSDQSLAALEGATWAPKMAGISTGCWETSLCPTEIAMTFVNGLMNTDFTLPTTSLGTNLTNNPLRQGLNSAVQGEGPAIHVMGEIPTLGVQQSPLWDIWIAEWVNQAVQEHLVTRVRDIFEGFGYSAEGMLINSPNGTELMSSSIVFNAPAVYRLY